MIETTQANRARQMLREEIERQNLDIGRMARMLQLSESNLASWINGAVKYTVDLKVRKYLGMPITQGRPPAHTPERDDSLSGYARKAIPANGIDHMPPPSVATEPWATDLGTAVFYPSPSNGHVEPAGDLEKFTFFDTAPYLPNGWHEPGIRISKSSGQIRVSKVLRELLGEPSGVRIGYRESDNAILILGEFREEDGSLDGFRLTTDNDFSATSVVAWMLAHGFERERRYTAVEAFGGALVTP